MTRYRKSLLGLSAIVAVAPAFFIGVPSEFEDIRTYSFYALAVLPVTLTALVAAQATERRWLYRVVMIFWSIAILLSALSLAILPTSDPWLGVIWYTVSEGWLAGAIVLACITGLLRWVKKEPNKALEPTAPSGRGSP